MKVARSELTFSTPTLAKIAVSAAKIADSTAQSCQDENTLELMVAPVGMASGLRELEHVSVRLTHSGAACAVCVPLPLVGPLWGGVRGGGPEIWLSIVPQSHHPPPQPSPTRGEGADRALSLRLTVPDRNVDYWTPAQGG